MSKASEWSAAMFQAKKSEPRRFEDPRRKRGHTGPYIDLHVAEGSGYCTFKVNAESQAWLPPDVALALARWIIDTFGEEG